jgi:hypothetical protein
MILAGANGFEWKWGTVGKRSGEMYQNAVKCIHLLAEFVKLMGLLEGTQAENPCVTGSTPVDATNRQTPGSYSRAGRFLLLEVLNFPI